MEAGNQLPSKKRFLNFQAKEFTLNESVNTQCYDAAVSEQIKCRKQSNVDQYNARVSLSKLKQQLEYKPKSESKLATLANYKNLSLPHLKQIYLSAQARMRQRRQENAANGVPDPQASLRHLLGNEKCLENVLINKTSVEPSLSNEDSGLDLEKLSEEFSESQNTPSFPCPSSPSASSVISTGQLSGTSDNTGPFPSLNNIDTGTDTCPLSAANSNKHKLQNSLKMKSLTSKVNPEMKKYRYNQTALALQQSGLMKTTIKTAELLRKSQLLQKELVKLQKETSTFVVTVLNNPENKHLKDRYSSLLLSRPASCSSE